MGSRQSRHDSSSPSPSPSPSPPASRFPALLCLAVTLSTFAALTPSCLDRRDDLPAPQDEARCATCHGDPARAGDFLARSAPPRDLLGAADPAHPGVGAHDTHLRASETHAAIACNECHVVPDTVEQAGHADDARPAELRFGSIATTGNSQPVYDAAARRCSDTWCHREADAIWTQPRTSMDACGSCHGLPPPAPHPQSARCDVCHGEVVDAERRIVEPMLHVDGKLQVEDGSCTACHGSRDDPAPPLDTLGNAAVSAIGVGAHQAHLAGGSSGRALECGECHTVPDGADSPGHADDALPAEVALVGVAETAGRRPTWDRVATSCADTWCHGPGAAPVAAVSPSWIEPLSLGCTGCHASPPPAPHPQMTDCSRCHGDVVAADDVSIANRDRHVDGVVDVVLDQTCTTCHGSGTDPAPPVDLSGSSDTSSPGVGAHQAHVSGTPRSRPVPCSECHVVPATLLEPGHVDTALPAELAFSGVALAFGASPSYSGTSCQSTSCHGAVLSGGHASGGTNTSPSWTIVDGSQAACGTCHGLPPPAPHPKAEFNPVCNACHENVAPDNVTFLKPDLHVDGIVTFTVP